jgi:putative SOS response-associated peptidase YedK
MCYYKSEVQKLNELLDHYAASFESLTGDLEPIQEKLEELIRKDDALKSIGMKNSHELGLQILKYSEKDALPSTLTKPELTQLRWYQRFLSAWQHEGLYDRYFENGFDYFPTHIITAGGPDKLKMFNWGLIPFFQKDRDKAMQSRLTTLNCISEEMWEKPSFRDAIKNGQRCLIPVTGFFEWRWLDDAGTVKIPYYVTFRDQKLRSMAGLYSRWKDPATGEYYYSYTLLTCPANSIMQYVHNAKQRMPVFIDQENYKDWLNPELKKDEVMDLCRPYDDPNMRAYTISKLLTTRGINPNVPEVLQPFNYNTAIQEANEFLKRGEKKKAMEVFKNMISGDKMKEEHLQLAAGQEIREELVMP